MKLTVNDYVTKPLIELSTHPDFDLETFQIVANLIKLVPSDYRNFYIIRGTIATLQTL